MSLVRILCVALVITICAPSLLASRCWAQQTPVPVLDAKTFGAVGDGVADDTLALQRCFDQAAAQIRELPLGDMTHYLYPQIVIPAGAYRLTNMLRLPPAALIVGAGAVLKQERPECDVLDAHLVRDLVLEGITITGGRRALHLYTGGLPGARMTIRDCVFQDARGFAVECIVRGADVDHLSGYYIQTGEAEHTYTYTETLDADAPYWPNVAVLHLDRCTFRNCYGVLHQNTACGSVTDCTIESSPAQQGATIVNAGSLKLTRVKAEGRSTPGQQQWWIDHLRGGLIVQDCRFTTEGAGWCLVRNHERYRDTAAGGEQHYLVVERCTLHCAGSAERAVVYCREVPNAIAIRECQAVQGSVPALAFARMPDAAYFSRITPDGLKYLIAGNSNITADLPAAMQRFVDKPLPAHVAALARPAPPALTLPGMRRLVWTALNIADYGARGDGVADDTPALLKALEAVGTTPGVEILFPPGHYLLHGPIDLPEDIILRGVGNAYLDGCGSRTLFQSEHARQISQRNLIVGNCSTAFVVTPHDAANTMAFIDHCAFVDTGSSAVRFGVFALPIGEKNRLQVRITDTAFSNCAQLVLSNAADCLIDHCWASTASSMDDWAAFANRGSMRCDAICGWPILDDWAKDRRWFDNYHRLVIDFFRFGSEGGGICAVNQCHAGANGAGHLIVQNSPIYALGNDSRKTAIFVEHFPKFIAVQSIVGMTGGMQRLLQFGYPARGMAIPKGWFYRSVNTIPANDPNKVVGR
jgi:hypothetical protein